MSRRNRNQQELNCAVANAIVENVHVVRHRGFSFINLREGKFDLDSDNRPPIAVDWDEQELSHRFDRAIPSLISLAEVA
ncbi:MAG: hypothetical protein JWM11_602 [Planctomycetaceae bacterium]|nr:hypothetical protein [Planctomycetaceae bacterium]